MILAAVNYAEGKGPPPPDLLTAFAARRWGALPEAGGLRDQPAGELDRMSATLNAFDAWSAWMNRDPEPATEWVKANPEMWKLVQGLMGLKNDGRGEQ